MEHLQAVHGRVRSDVTRQVRRAVLASALTVHNPIFRNRPSPARASSAAAASVPTSVPEASSAPAPAPWVKVQSRDGQRRVLEQSRRPGVLSRSRGHAQSPGRPGRLGVGEGQVFRNAGKMTRKAVGERSPSLRARTPSPESTRPASRLASRRPRRRLATSGPHGSRRMYS